VLASLGRALYRLAVLASPFMPGKAQRIWRSLGLAADSLATSWSDVEQPPVAGLLTTKPEVLFPKPQAV
jgi:methionyl-tRNA synthetase